MNVACTGPGGGAVVDAVAARTLPAPDEPAAVSSSEPGVTVGGTGPPDPFPHATASPTSTVAISAASVRGLSSTVGRSVDRELCRGGRPLQLVDLQLVHAHHRPHHPLALLAVGVAEQAWQCGRHDLPGEAVAVLQPPAWALLTALREHRPVRVDLLLGLAADRERHGLGERVLGGRR
jgi:hypothetical protein